MDLETIGVLACETNAAGAFIFSLQLQRRGPESNRRIAVLQTAALPLGYRARNSP
jgi:hypothetical protein